MPDRVVQLDGRGRAVDHHQPWPGKDRRHEDYRRAGCAGAAVVRLRDGEQGAVQPQLGMQVAEQAAEPALECLPAAAGDLGVDRSANVRPRRAQRPFGVAAQSRDQPRPSPLSHQGRRDGRRGPHRHQLGRVVGKGHRRHTGQLVAHGGGRVEVGRVQEVGDESATRDDQAQQTQIGGGHVAVDFAQQRTQQRRPIPIAPCPHARGHLAQRRVPDPGRAQRLHAQFELDHECGPAVRPPVMGSVLPGRAVPAQRFAVRRIDDLRQPRTGVSRCGWPGVLTKRWRATRGPATRGSAKSWGSPTSAPPSGPGGPLRTR